MLEDTEKLIEKFCVNSLKATSVLYQDKLYGQMLVLLYSSVDAMGLLDAPPQQVSASGASFKEWVKKYILPNGEFEFNEDDFWSSRCSVLHTFTSESNLTRSGSAKQIQYYLGPKDSTIAKAFVKATRDIDNGNHVPADLEDTYLAFIEGLKKFSKDLLRNCEIDEIYGQRVRKVLQSHSL